MLARLWLHVPVQISLQIFTADLHTTYRLDERLSSFSLTHSDGPSLSEGGVRLSPQFGARSPDAFVLIAAESMLADSIVMHADMHADSAQRIRRCVPKAQSFTSNAFTTSYTLFLKSVRSDHTNCAVDFVQCILG